MRKYEKMETDVCIVMAIRLLSGSFFYFSLKAMICEFSRRSLWTRICCNFDIQVGDMLKALLKSFFWLLLSEFALILVDRSILRVFFQLKRGY